MTAAGDHALAVAYTQVGITESPAGSNNVKYWDPWGGNYGAWCAAFVSWVYAEAGYPLPPIDGAPGFSYVPSGQIAAYTTGHSVGEGGVEPGDSLMFSWEPWHISGGIAICSYGVYAGSPAGDHTGFFAAWAGGGYMVTVEGNTSQSSWDNGGAVMERSDRYSGQICCYARHAALGAGGPPPPPPAPTYPLTRLAMFLLQSNNRGIWLMGAGYAHHLDPEAFSQVAGIPGIGTFNCGDNDRSFDVIHAACLSGTTADDIH